MNTALEEKEARRRRRKESVSLHLIEGYTFSSEQNALFDMFDHEGLSDKARRKYLKHRAEERAMLPEAAE